MIRVLVMVTVLAAALLVAVPTVEALPEGFVETEVVTGLDAPAAVAFSADGHVFVGEKSGVVRVGHEGTDRTTVFADLRTQVHNYWDRGLLGLAIHPEYPAEPYVYVMYAHDAPMGGTAPRWGEAGVTGDGCPDPPGGSADGCVVSVRISRLDATDHHAGDAAATEEVLVEDWCQQYPSHSAGTLAFGADGALYASGGDGASFSFFDYGQRGDPPNPCGDAPVGLGGLQQFPSSEGGALRSQDLRTGGDPAALSGSVIRIDPETGEGLPDNPLASSSDPNLRRVVAHGLRNPFRFAVGPGERELWLADVGLSTWEEVNHVPDATARMTNLGWPCFEGADRGPGEGFDICEGLYADTDTPATPPFFAYRHDADVPDGSCDRVGGSSISGIAMAPGAGVYPPVFDDALFVADYARGCIWALPRGADGLPDPSALQTFHGSASTPVQLQIGPDGRLHYVDIAGGRIVRLDHEPLDAAPTARATASATEGPVPLEVTFDAGGSTDPEGGALSYAWDLDGDGAHDDADVARPTWRYEETATITVGLRVTDPAGQVGSDTLTVWAGNTSPVPEIELPATGETWAVGQQVAFAGSATDPEDGPLPEAALSWSLEVLHCASLDEQDCHTHDIQTYEATASGSFTGPAHDHPSWLRLTLTATDAAGLSASRTLRLDPRTVDVTLASDPPGLELSLNGEPATAPSRTVLIEGSSVTIGAPSPQQLDGTRYALRGWSDGGDATHTVTVGASATFTAEYAAVGEGYLVGSDIGGPLPPGTMSSTGGVHTIDGGGGDIWGTADAFHFASRPLPGDGQVVARVSSQTPTNEWAKAGVMLRAGLAADAPNVALFLTPEHGVVLQHRAVAGGTTSSVSGPATGAPVHLRLARRGDTVSAAVSADGQDWTPVGQAPLVAGVVEAGLAVTSHNQGWASTVTFDDVRVGDSLPEGWSAVSDLPFEEIANGYGPVERDTSNGEDPAGDGRPLTLAGQTYAKGLGVHADSEVGLALGGRCRTFAAVLGVDDEVGDQGSVRFRVLADGEELFASELLTGASAPVPVRVPLDGRDQLTLRVDQGPDNPWFDHADWADAQVDCGDGGLPEGWSAVSDLPFEEIANGYGPVERDTSNGEDPAGDGRPLTLAGQTYAKGLGVHADSEVGLALGGRCRTFAAVLGVDDEVGDQGSVRFRVLADGEELFASELLTGASAPVPVRVPLDGRDQLTLRVDQGPDNPWFDHADWADAQVDCGDGPAGNRPPTIDPPGDQTGAEGEPVELAIGAGDPDLGDVLAFRVTGLPPGLSIAADTGVITGVPAAGSAGGSPYAVTVTATDDGDPPASSSARFAWTIGAPVTGILGPAASFPAGRNAHSVEAADLDGTAGLDLLVATPGDDAVAVLAGRGDGSFAAPRRLPTGTFPKYATAADLDGDGDRDIVTANQDSTDGADVTVLRNAGDGTFAPGTDHAACSRPHEVATGDLDGNGDLDVAVACWGGDVLSVLLGDGEGSLRPAVEVPTGANPHALVVADLDGDGALDIASANLGDGAVGVLLGAGDGTFAPVVRHAVGPGPHDIDAGDVDGDGVLDLVTANQGGDDVGVLIGRGDGTFAPARRVPAGAVPKSVDLGDVDGDGALDVVTANSHGNYPDGTADTDVSVLLGDGAGGFDRPTTHPVDRTPFGVALADLDADGRLDVATANWHSDDVGVLRNTGNG